VNLFIFVSSHKQFLFFNNLWPNFNFCWHHAMGLLGFLDVFHHEHCWMNLQVDTSLIECT